MRALRNSSAALRTVLGGAALAFLAGCDSGSTTPGDVVASVEISPPSLTLDPGGSAPLLAIVRDGAGEVVAVGVTWSAEPGTVATVSAGGVVTAVGAGDAVVTAEAGGVEAEAAVTVVSAPRGLHLEPIVTIPGAPVFLTSPPGDGRLFVVEQQGRIWIVEDDALRTTPFLDLRGSVGGPVVFGGERGLLGLTFHPDYAANGRFYVNYTGAGGQTRVESYTVGGDPDVADAGSGSLILSQDQPFSNHNGGQLAFGPDGMLYIGLGDGGSGGDPEGNGQDTFTWLGTLLRIDVDGGTPYAIPAGNPFDGGDGLEEIWAYGLRNPWRWSFDPALGVLIIADVGQNAWEEVNVQPAGAAGLNYGWNVMEASTCFGGGGCDMTGLELPDYDYEHVGGACSVTGGYVYRGALAPSLAGHYVFGDYCAGWFRALDLDGSSVSGSEELDLPDVGRILSFGVDAARELYVLVAGGEVFRFEEGE